jgi:HlyD family secretion protein
LKKLFSMRHSKLVIVLLVIVIVVIALVFTNNPVKNKINKTFFSKASVTQRTTTVKKGDLQVLVSGSGPIYFANDKILYPKIGATVTKVNYSEGDQVKTGDVIAEFDDSDFQSTILSDQLSLEQSELAVQEDNQSISELNIAAPFTGQVSNIVNAGDTVQPNGTVLTISDTSKLKLSLTYNAADAAKIKVGQSADVYISSSMQSTKGTVTYVSNVSNGTSVGGVVYTVDIEVPNPGALTSGMTASADITTSSGVVSSTNTAALSYINTQSVISKTGGTVENVYVKENQQVSSGTVLIVMEDDDLLNALKADNLKLANMQNTLNQNMQQLDNYEIVAPFDGTITSLNVKVGDTVTAGEEIADVADTTTMEFDIPVDELDIAKLAVGQKANISVDALPDTSTTPVEGEVAKIAVAGTAVSGVTTFPVTIKIGGNLGKLKGGMNANADIVVSDESNVLYVPVEAVTTVGTKSYVWVMGNGSGSSGYSGFSSGTTSRVRSSNSGNGSYSGGYSNNGSDSGSANANNEATVSTEIKSNNSYSGGSGGTKVINSYYANAVRKEVVVGANSDTDIEIKSGLTEGEVVILPKLQTSSGTTSTSTTTRTGGGMMGGGF